MKQLNHSPEAAAAVLGLSLKVAHERIAWLRKQGARRIPNAKLTIYPEAMHDSWTETYDNPKLYDWFLAHQRKY